MEDISELRRHIKQMRGLKFRPSDQLLVERYLYYKHHYSDYFPDPVFEYDLYGDAEPWQIWELFHGVDGQDLYFFTRLKRSTTKSGQSSSHVSRKVGLAGGTWTAENSLTPVFGTHNQREVIGYRRRLRYENPQVPEHHGEWIMHEFSLHEKFVQNNNPGSNYVVCRVKKKENVKIKTKTMKRALMAPMGSNRRFKKTRKEQSNSSMAPVSEQSMAPASEQSHSSMAPTWEESLMAPAYEHSLMAPASEHSLMALASEQSLLASAYEQSLMAPAYEQSLMAPTYEHSLMAPTYEHSLMAPASEHSLMAPASEHSLMAPASEHNLMAPASEHSLMAPASEQSLMAPANEQSLMAPTYEHSLMAPTYEHSLMAPASEHSLMAPANEQSLMAPTYEHSLMAPTYEHSLMAPASEHSLMAPASEHNLMAPAYEHSLMAPAYEQSGDPLFETFEDLERWIFQDLEP